MLPIPDNDDPLYAVALSMVDGIGARTGRVLLDHFGSARAALLAPLRQIRSLPGVGEIRARAFKDPAVLRNAEQEIVFAAKHGIRMLGQGSADYPRRLMECPDAPLMLYYKGSAPPETVRMVAVVGTRRQTDYGTELCESLVDALRAVDGLTVVSGLALGVDGVVHRRCVRAGIPTIGVVAHGLDRMYPFAHRELARDMVNCGGILTEFPSRTKPDRTNFPIRNRLVAGLSDVTVIVESDEKGGAMITAYMAAGYNREVAAFPGRISDTRSAGPLKLIRMNIASLIRNADDLLELMNWRESKPAAQQPELFTSLTPHEEQIIAVLRGSDALHADEILLATQLRSSGLAATLLELEMKGLIRSLPGKRYRLAGNR